MDPHIYTRNTLAQQAGCKCRSLQAEVCPVIRAQPLEDHRVNSLCTTIIKEALGLLDSEPGDGIKQARALDLLQTLLRNRSV